MANIFELLNLNQQAHPRAVKKAYLRKILELHPDRNNGVQLQEFLDIQAAWEAYRNSQPSATRSAHASTSMPQSFAVPVVEESDALMIPRHGYIRVFVLTPWSAYRVPLEEQPRDEENYCYIRKGRNPALAPIVNQINSFLSQQANFVGLDKDEVININNQHKHHCRMLIVEVEVALMRLSESKKAEKDFSHALNAASGQFFYLIKNTQIAVDDIVSVEAMPINCYGNTTAFASDRVCQQVYWPDGYIYYPSEQAIAEPQKALPRPGYEDANQNSDMPSNEAAVTAGSIFKSWSRNLVTDIIKQAWRETYAGNSLFVNIVTGVQKCCFEFLPRCFELLFEQWGDINGVNRLCKNLFKVIHIILRPISSPIKSMRLANAWSKKMRQRYGFLGGIVGALAPLASGLMTFAGNAALLLTPLGFFASVIAFKVAALFCIFVGAVAAFVLHTGVFESQNRKLSKPDQASKGLDNSKPSVALKNETYTSFEDKNIPVPPQQSTARLSANTQGLWGGNGDPVSNSQNHSGHQAKGLLF